MDPLMIFINVFVIAGAGILLLGLFFSVVMPVSAFLGDVLEDWLDYKRREIRDNREKKEKKKEKEKSKRLL